MAIGCSERCRRGQGRGRRRRGRGWDGQMPLPRPSPRLFWIARAWGSQPPAPAGAGAPTLRRLRGGTHRHDRAPRGLTGTAAAYRRMGSPGEGRRERRGSAHGVAATRRLRRRRLSHLTRFGFDRWGAKRRTDLARSAGELACGESPSVNPKEASIGNNGRGPQMAARIPLGSSL